MCMPKGEGQTRSIYFWSGTDTLAWRGEAPLEVSGGMPHRIFFGKYH